MEERTWSVPIEDGETEVLLHAPKSARASVVLAHGAGGNRNSPHLGRLSELLVASGLAVARFDFPYRVRGRKIPDRMPVLARCYRSVAESVREASDSGRLILGGHSMGGRCASVVAAEGFRCDGVLLFSYPLHPPGQPEKLRDAHLPAIEVPSLCFNGTCDPFCECALMEPILPRLRPQFQMHWIEQADHSLHVTKRSGRTRAEVDRELAEILERWLKELDG